MSSLNDIFNIGNDNFKKMMEIITISKNKIYDKDEYYESHHIIPKFYFKMINEEIDNTNNNLVNLTAKEHFLVHYFAWKCSKKEYKTKFASVINLMCGVLLKKIKDNKEIYVLSNLYDEARKQAAYDLSLKKEGFIERAKQIHGDKYDYSLVDYKNKETKVEIICKKCNKSFFMKPGNHLNKQGCPTCGKKYLMQKDNLRRMKKAKEEFETKAKQKHGDEYDYSLVDYKNSLTKVEIICKKCGEHFLQTPSNHLSGNGCPTCAKEKKGKATLLPLEKVLESFKQVHGDKYDYSLVDYKNNLTKVEIICKKCGEHFLQTPKVHKRGSGCPNHCYNKKEK